MSDSSDRSDRDARHQPAATRAQLARILASQTFAQAPTLRRLLDHLAKHTLEGRDLELKEYAIGVDVFNRGADFDPRTDTIVRVQARRLRAKLEEYYRREGVADPITLEVPKGRYVVQCRPASREQPLAAVVSRQPAPARLPGMGERAMRADAPSIVILPFANLSGDAENEYLTDGLTDEITSTLASVAPLRVVARTSAFQFKGRSDDIRKIGRELGVETALEGSVRRDGDRIRVTAQLINIADGFQLWSRIYEGELPGVFTLQEEATRSIVEALRIRLTAGEQERLRPQEPATIEAYEPYLKGLFFLHRAAAADLQASIDYMQRAVAIDPDYAPAYAGMANAYFTWATMGDRPAPELMASARRAAPRALEIGDVAEAHGAMGAVLAVADWDWFGAEREFRRALELNSSLVFARISYVAVCLCPMRRYDEAIEQIRYARAIDPASAFVRAIFGQTLLLADRPGEAVEQLRQALELEPSSVFSRYTLAIAHLVTDSFTQAISALEPIQHLAGQYPNCAGHLGYSHARAGNRAEAERLLQLLLDRFPGAWAPWVDVAAIHNGLGDATQALDWLERGYQQRCFDALFIRDDPRFRNLQSHPRFMRLAEELGARTAADPT